MVGGPFPNAGEKRCSRGIEFIGARRWFRAFTPPFGRMGTPPAAGTVCRCPFCQDKISPPSFPFPGRGRGEAAFFTKHCPERHAEIGMIAYTCAGFPCPPFAGSPPRSPLSSAVTRAALNR